MYKQIFSNRMHTSTNMIQSTSSRLNPFDKITFNEYKQRRINFLNKLPDSTIAIIPGTGLRYSSQNIFYPFKQNTNILYLCGLDESDTALVFTKDSFTIYLKPPNPSTEIWDGKRISLKEAVDVYGADDSKPIHELPAFIKSLSQSGVSNIVTDLNLGITQESSTDVLKESGINTSNSHAADSTCSYTSLPDILKPFHSSKTFNFNFPFQYPSISIQKASNYLDSLRLIKTDAEISIMRKSGQISGRAFACVSIL
jgi:intermediate cleaving peptidase 55